MRRGGGLPGDCIEWPSRFCSSTRWWVYSLLVQQVCGELCLIRIIHYNELSEGNWSILKDKEETTQFRTGDFTNPVSVKPLKGIPNRAECENHSKTNCIDETSNEEQFPFWTCLLTSDPNDVEKTSNPDYWLTTNSIQQENGREKANCVAARSTTIPSTLPSRWDEIFTEDRVKGNAILFLERTLHLMRSVWLSYYSHHQQSGSEVEPEHYRPNRGVKGP